MLPNKDKYIAPCVRVKRLKLSIDVGSTNFYSLYLMDEWCRRGEFFFHTWSGGNSDGPGATGDGSEAILVVWRQPMMVWRQL